MKLVCDPSKIESIGVFQWKQDLDISKNADSSHYFLMVLEGFPFIMSKHQRSFI